MRENDFWNEDFEDADMNTYFLFWYNMILDKFVVHPC